MIYKDMLKKLKENHGLLLARREAWPDADKVAYDILTDSMEKRENGVWIPYTSPTEDALALDWYIVSPYS